MDRTPLVGVVVCLAPVLLTCVGVGAAGRAAIGARRSDVPSVEEVKLHLAASVDQTQRAMIGIRAVTDQLDEALARLRLTAVGSATRR